MPTKTLPYIFDKTQDADWGRCGFELDIYKAPKSSKNPLITLKGGLGDAGSLSLKPLREAILDLTHGKISVATIGTLRPFNLYESVRILTSPAEESRARQQRMHSMRRGTEKAVALTGARFVLLGGQSQGAVTAIDTGKKMLNTESHAEQPKIAVATINAPGVYESLEYEGVPLKGLIDLGAHCLPALASLSCYEKYRLIKDYLKNPRLVLELPYLLGEIEYLKSIGLQDEIEALRLGGVAVGHIFHDQDIVEGAVDALQDPSAVVFPGIHTTFMIVPVPVAEALVNMSYELYENPSNVINLSQMSSYYIPETIAG